MDINTSLISTVGILYLIHLILNGYIANKAGRSFFKYILISIMPLVNWLVTFYLLTLVAKKNA